MANTVTDDYEQETRIDVEGSDENSDLLFTVSPTVLQFRHSPDWRGVEMTVMGGMYVAFSMNPHAAHELADALHHWARYVEGNGGLAHADLAERRNRGD